MYFISEDGSVEIEINKLKGIIKIGFPIANKRVRFESNFVNPYMAFYGFNEIAIGLKWGYVELSNSNSWRTLHLYNKKDEILVFKNGTFYLNGNEVFANLTPKEIRLLASELERIYDTFYSKFEDDGDGQRHLAALLVRDGSFKRVDDYTFEVNDKLVTIRYDYSIWSVRVNHDIVGGFKIKSPKNMTVKLIDEIYDACA